MTHRPVRVALLLALVLLILPATLVLRPGLPGAERPTPAPAAGARIPEVVPGEYVVKFHAGTPHADRDAAHRSARSRLVRRLDAADLDVVSPTDDVEAALARYRRSPQVAFVEPNYVVRTTLVPNDPIYKDEWAMPKIGAPQAWDVTTGSAAVVIAVVDTGVDPGHPDLVDNLLPGWNVIAGNDRPFDDNGHGTHVASTAAARGDNGIGVVGVTWQSKILPVKVLDAQGSGNTANAAVGVRWAVDHGARVINMSWGTLANTAVISDAVAYARSHGVVLVAAAGNFGVSLPFYPAAMDGVIGVSAIGEDDNTPSWSNYGTYVDIAAPGVNIWGALPNSRYEPLSGTSMASPHVAGAAALVLSVRPDLTPDQVEQMLLNNAIDLGLVCRDDRYGAGRLNVHGAVLQAGTSPAISVPNCTRLVLPIVVKEAS
ncbi:MAG: peptidase S8 [Chloroflexi bacterium]|nr:peptidase S8 [Chloroflexota bacterium]